MRRPELDHILSTMLDSAAEVSDLIFTVEKPLQVESAGFDLHIIRAWLNVRSIEDAFRICSNVLPAPSLSINYCHACAGHCRPAGVSYKPGNGPKC